MLSNRSIPRATVIPVLAYPDVNKAAAWLSDAFGFTVRLRIGNHRIQLNVADAAVIVREMRPNEADALIGSVSKIKNFSGQSTAAAASGPSGSSITGPSFCKTPPRQGLAP